MIRPSVYHGAFLRMERKPLIDRLSIVKFGNDRPMLPCPKTLTLITENPGSVGWRDGTTIARPKIILFDQDEDRFCSFGYKNL
jgi:hypothetical protein